MRVGRQPRTARALGLALVLVALLLCGLAQTAPGRDSLGSLGLASTSDGYTELSFARPADLPEQLGARPVVVPFLVHNLQKGPRRYAWVVEQGVGRDRRAVASGTTPEVPVGRSAYVGPRLAVPCSGRRVLTTVRLRGVAQTIDFWARCTNGGPR